MAWKVQWRVLVDGLDLTAAWAPVLIDITVTDQDGTSSDNCSLTVDDAAGKIRLPRKGQRLVVFLQGVKLFEGTLEQPVSSGDRSGGRTLKLKAKGFDSGGKVKEPQSFHMDDATLGDFLGKAAENAGLDLVADPSLAGIARDYWSAEGQNILALGESLARKLGGTFKVRGDKAVLAKRGQGLSPDGAALPTVLGQVGQNVIGWSITPRDPRRTFGTGSARWFDRNDAEFKRKVLDFGNEGAPAENATRWPSADEGEADEANDSHKREGEREAGGGSVDLDLTVEAQAEGTFVLTGAREGVDGRYRIASVTHKASRSGGSTTSLELKQPGEGAGTDERSAA